MLMESEYEIVRFDRIPHMKLFINELEYRTSHLHKEFEVIYVVKNPLMLKFPGTEHILNEGQACILNPNQVHMMEKVSKPCSFICIQFAATLFDEIFHALSNYRFPLMNIMDAEGIDSHELRKTILTLALHYQNLDDIENLEITGYLLHLVYLIVKGIPHTSLSKKEKEEEEKNVQRISRLLAFIDNNYTHKINLSEFAEQEGLTLTYLSHFAKKVLSEPFQDYVNSLRFNLAKKLIYHEGLSIAEAAYESGFSDPRYLTRSFEKYMGISAREYSKTMRTGRSSENESDMKTHISAHSLERYYTRRKCIDLLEPLLEAHDRK